VRERRNAPIARAKERPCHASKAGKSAPIARRLTFFWPAPPRRYDDEEKKKLAGNERWKNEPIKEGKNGLLMLDGQQAFTSIKGVDASIRCMKATVLNFGRKFSEGTLGGERNSDMPEAVQVVNRLPEWNKEQKR
jgi:hypothetical protein